MYRYMAFGLHIASDIILEELIPDESHETIDIRILLGIVPEHIEQSIGISQTFETSLTEVLFKIDNVARFYVFNGNNIIVEPQANAELSTVKLYILGTCFGIIFFQRGHITFHGSGLNVKGKGIIITGVSGAGKSTLTKALLDKGCSLLTDDLIVLNINDTSTMIEPSYPKQKLWEDSANYFNICTNNLQRTDNEVNKYYIPVNNYQKTPQRLNAIYLIQPNDIDKVEVLKVIGSEKLKIVFEHTYLFPAVKWFGILKNHFILYGKMLKNIDIYIINRPSNIYTIDDQVIAILNTLASA